MIALAETFLIGLAAYFAAGIIVAILFLVFVVHRIDASARGATRFFRPTIFLGCVMLWPVILARALSGKTINEPTENAP